MCFLYFCQVMFFNDEVLMPVFCSKSDGIDNEWMSFMNHVNR